MESTIITKPEQTLLRFRLKNGQRVRMLLELFQNAVVPCETFALLAVKSINHKGRKETAKYAKEKFISK